MLHVEWEFAIKKVQSYYTSFFFPTGRNTKNSIFNLVYNFVHLCSRQMNFSVYKDCMDDQGVGTEDEIKTKIAHLAWEISWILCQ